MFPFASPSAPPSRAREGSACAGTAGLLAVVALVATAAPAAAQTFWIDLDISGEEVREGDRAGRELVFTVTRTHEFYNTWQIETVGGTATAGVDYTATTSPIYRSAESTESTTTTFRVPILPTRWKRPTRPWSSGSSANTAPGGWSSGERSSRSLTTTAATRSGRRGP